MSQGGDAMESGRTEQHTGILSRVITGLAALFSLFYLYHARTGTTEPYLVRAIYLAGTYILVIALMPAIKKPAAGRPGWQRALLVIWDLLMLALTVLTFGYFITQFDALVERAGAITAMDRWMGLIAVVVSLEVARRAMGWSLPLIAVVFLLYSAFGNHLPGLFNHRGYSFNRIIMTQYTSYDGIFGVVTSIFATYVFLFVIFGTFLERSGASRFFIDLSYAVAGRTRGGPAKVAVLVSGLMGSISGSAVANVLTTGAFTIPLMKRTGYKAEQAGAIEAAASTGGQLMPPIMGAGAFLISEFTGIPYWEVVKVSFVPAVLYYFSVLYLVDLTAARMGLKGLAKKELPDFWQVFREGWLYILPLIQIVVMLFMGYTPMAAGFWSTVVVTLVGLYKRTIRLGEIWGILAQAARNSLTVGATAGVIGIIIGSVYLTGLGLKFSDIVLSFSGGYLFLALVLVTLASYVLGMGLTVTSSYIVLAILAVPALQELGVGLLAAHLIVFWVSQDANVTPPVCLAAFAGASIAKADPMRTGWQAWKYAKGLYLIPVLMAYSPAFLFDGPLSRFFLVTPGAILGILAGGAALEGFFVRQSRWWERLVLGVAALLLWTPHWPSDLAGLVLLVAIFAYQGGFVWLRSLRGNQTAA